MAQLYITRAGQTTAHQLTGPVGTEYSIGKDEGNSIVIPDAPELSATQCLIIRAENGYAIRSDSSSDGVTLEGRKIDYELMLAGETYAAGSVQLVLIEEDAEPKAAAQRVLKKKKAGTTKKAASGASVNLAALAEQYKRNEGLSGVDIVYIIVILVAAVYAGMALYSWQHDGNPLPIIFR